jgi:hypothetical protein
MFGKEFYGGNEEIEKILDVDQYTTFLENNQIFFKLLKEYLLILRKKRNIRRNLKVIPIPKGSLVYAKILLKFHVKRQRLCIYAHLKRLLPNTRLWYIP